MFIEEKEQEVLRAIVKKDIEIPLHSNPPPRTIKVKEVLHVRQIPKHPKRVGLVNNARRDIHLHRGVTSILLKRVFVIHVGVKLNLQRILRTSKGRRL